MLSPERLPENMRSFRRALREEVMVEGSEDQHVASRIHARESDVTGHCARAFANLQVCDDGGQVLSFATARCHNKRRC